MPVWMTQPVPWPKIHTNNPWPLAKQTLPQIVTVAVTVTVFILVAKENFERIIPNPLPQCPTRILWMAPVSGVESPQAALVTVTVTASAVSLAESGHKHSQGVPTACSLRTPGVLP